MPFQPLSAQTKYQPAWFFRQVGRLVHSIDPAKKYRERLNQINRQKESGQLVPRDQLHRQPEVKLNKRQIEERIKQGWLKPDLTERKGLLLTREKHYFDPTRVMQVEHYRKRQRKHKKDPLVSLKQLPELLPGDQWSDKKIRNLRDRGFLSNAEITKKEIIHTTKQYDLNKASDQLDHFHQQKKRGLSDRQIQKNWEAQEINETESS